MYAKAASLVLVASLSGLASAQNPPTGAEAQFQLGEPRSVSTIERELIPAGQRGYAVEALSGLRFIVRRDGAPHVYEVLATRREDTIIKELNAAGARGFRIIPQAVTTVGNEWVIVIEKIDGKTFTYTGVAGDDKVTAAVGATRKKGGTIAAVLGKVPGEFGRAFGGNPTPLIVLQHDSAAPVPGDEREYRVVSTRRTGSLEKEIQEAGKAGYRPIGSGFMTTVLEKAPGQADAREYRVIATRRASTALLEISQLANEGYRVVAMPGHDNEWIFVMERDPRSAGRYDYLLNELRKDSVDEFLRAATGKGYRIVGIVEHIVVIEKPAD